MCAGHPPSLLPQCCRWSFLHPSCCSVQGLAHGDVTIDNIRLEEEKPLSDGRVRYRVKIVQYAWKLKQGDDLDDDGRCRGGHCG